LVKSLSISKKYELFRRITEEINVKPTLVAVTIQEKLKCLKRKDKNIDLISDEKFYELFEMLSENKFSKEAVPIILEFLADNHDKSVKTTISELGIKPMSIKELNDVIDKVLLKNTGIRFNAVMGEVMKIARNRIDGKLVKDAVENKL